MNQLLVIEGIAVRRDNDGCYCLNDLHYAAIQSGLNARTKEPSKFLANSQTNELVQELAVTQNVGIVPVAATKGGQHLESYFCKKIVYDYPARITPPPSQKDQSHFSKLKFPAQLKLLAQIH